MKKEKTIRTYQRRTKSGKIVTVKQHTAKYDAAEKAKEAAKKKGAGNELEAKMKRLRLKELIGKELPEEEVEKKVLDEDEKEAKKKGKIRPVGTGTNGPEPKKSTAKSKPKKAESAASNSAFTAAEFKEWYHGTGSAADKKVAKALRAQLGRAGYRKLEDEAIDNYSSRGHLSMFKRVSGGSSVGGAKETQKGKASTATDLASIKVPKGYTLQGKPRPFKDDEGKGHKVSALNKDGYKVTLYRYDDATAKKLGENNKRWSLEFGSETPIKKKNTMKQSAGAEKGKKSEPKGATKTGKSSSSAPKKGEVSGNEYFDGRRWRNLKSLPKSDEFRREVIENARKEGHIINVSTEKSTKTGKSAKKSEKETSAETGGKKGHKTVPKSSYKKYKEDPTYERRLEKDPKFASSEAVKGAKAELRGYGKQTPASIARQYGKGSKEYKGYMKLYSTPVPKDPKKAAVRNAVLQGFGRAGDDTCRDLLVANGYPHTHAYSKGVKEITALAKKYGIDW